MIIDTQFVTSISMVLHWCSVRMYLKACLWCFLKIPTSRSVQPFAYGTISVMNFYPFGQLLSRCLSDIHWSHVAISSNKLLKRHLKVCCCGFCFCAVVTPHNVPEIVATDIITQRLGIVNLVLETLMSHLGDTWSSQDLDLVSPVLLKHAFWSTASC